MAVGAGLEYYSKKKQKESDMKDAKLRDKLSKMLTELEADLKEYKGEESQIQISDIVDIITNTDITSKLSVDEFMYIASADYTISSVNDVGNLYSNTLCTDLKRIH
jgi:hypothetical protein